MHSQGPFWLIGLQLQNGLCYDLFSRQVERNPTSPPLIRYRRMDDSLLHPATPCNPPSPRPMDSEGTFTRWTSAWKHEGRESSCSRVWLSSIYKSGRQVRICLCVVEGLLQMLLKPFKILCSTLIMSSRLPDTFCPPGWKWPRLVWLI